MSTYNIESAEYAISHTLSDGYACAEHNFAYPFAVIFNAAGNYTYELMGNAAGDDVTSYFAAGIPIAIRPRKIYSTGAPSGTTTCTLLYRK
jgi:hypothetical protein